MRERIFVVNNVGQCCSFPRHIFEWIVSKRFYFPLSRYGHLDK